MNRMFLAGAVISVAWLSIFGSSAHAAPCLMITLTGTQGGPPAFKGLAAPGTLVRYGEDANNCSAVKLQFDTGRGTVMRLAELDISPEQLNAVFFTHLHTDHTEGFADLVTLRWMFFGAGPKIDAVCSSDVVSTLGFTISCQKFAAHVADSFVQSGEVAQRHSEIKERTAGGPADLINTITFEAKDEPQTVWSSGDVRVSAIRSTHIAGHVSYRVDTSVGRVVIGGDATNDVPLPPRSSSASEQVEKLAKGRWECGRRSSGVNGGQTGREDDIDLALDQLHCNWDNASGIAAGRANDEFDIIRLSVSSRLKSIPERSDARRQG